MTVIDITVYNLYYLCLIGVYLCNLWVYYVKYYNSEIHKSRF